MSIHSYSAPLQNLRILNKLVLCLLLPLLLPTCGLSFLLRHHSMGEGLFLSSFFSYHLPNQYRFPKLIKFSLCALKKIFG